MTSIPSWETLLQGLLLHLKASGRAKRTLEDYTYQVHRFFKAHPDAWPTGLKEACLTYFSALADESIAPATYNLARQYLRAFFAWCAEEGAIPSSPITKLPKRKDEPKVRRIDERIIEKLLSLPDQETFAGLRDYAFMLFQLDTGVRPGEAIRLLPYHFDFASHHVEVPAEKAKTRTSRILPLYVETEKAVQRLLAARHPSWRPTSPVFCTFAGKPLRVDTWAKIMQKYSEELGHRVRPYDLRHTFAIMFLRGGGNVFSLQEMMGHTDLTMTRRYVALAESDIKEQHEIASPVARLVPPKGRVGRIKKRK